MGLNGHTHLYTSEGNTWSTEYKANVYIIYASRLQSSRESMQSVENFVGDIIFSYQERLCSIFMHFNFAFWLDSDGKQPNWQFIIYNQVCIQIFQCPLWKCMCRPYLIPHMAIPLSSLSLSGVCDEVAALCVALNFNSTLKKLKWVCTGWML